MCQSYRRVIMYTCSRGILYIRFVNSVNDKRRLLNAIRFIGFKYEHFTLPLRFNIKFSLSYVIINTIVHFERIFVGAYLRNHFTRSVTYQR